MYALDLDPGGSARLPMFIEANQRSFAADCSANAPSPLEPGHYQLRVTIGEDTVTADLDVKPPR